AGIALEVAQLIDRAALLIDGGPRSLAALDDLLDHRASLLRRLGRLVVERLTDHECRLELALRLAESDAEGLTLSLAELRDRETQLLLRISKRLVRLDQQGVRLSAQLLLRLLLGERGSSSRAFASDLE